MSKYRFDSRFFLQVPNSLLNLVQDGVLRPRDIFTYAYLKDVIGPKKYSLQRVEAMAKDLDECTTAIKQSLARLKKGGVISRERTVRITKTFVKVSVKTRNQRVIEALQRRRDGNAPTGRGGFPPPE